MARPGLILPLPGHTFHTLDRVVASVWTNDEAREPEALLLVIAPSAPYYRVLDVAYTGWGWVITQVTEHVNIVPAVEEYVSRGGDY